jgi:hypothetical protein
VCGGGQSNCLTKAQPQASQNSKRKQKEGRKGAGGGSGWGGGGQGGSHLVVLSLDHEHQLEGFALAEGHASLLLLAAPLAALPGVEDHLVPAVEAGIEVESHICLQALPHGEVHVESGGT